MNILMIVRHSELFVTTMEYFPFTDPAPCNNNKIIIVFVLRFVSLIHY